MQTSLPLLIVRPSILNPVKHFSTQPLIGKMKCPTTHIFALRIPFHLLKCWCYTSTNLHQAFFIIIMSRHLAWSSLNEYDPLHIIMWPYWFIDLNFAWSSPLPWSIGAKSLLKLSRHMWFFASKPPTYPSHLQPVHRRKALSRSSPSSHKTLYHVSYAMNSFITLYEHSINT